MKKITLLFITTLFIFASTKAEAKTSVGIQGGFTDRVYTNDQVKKNFHFVGGHFEINYFSLEKSMNKKGTSTVALDISFFYAGTTANIVIGPFSYSETWHAIEIGFGPVFTFALSQKLDLFFRGNIGTGLDIATSTMVGGSSGTGKNLFWRLGLGVNINLNEKIGIPIEAGYLGTYTLAKPEDLLMHGVQVSTGVRIYF